MGGAVPGTGVQQEGGDVFLFPQRTQQELEMMLVVTGALSTAEKAS